MDAEPDVKLSICWKCANRVVQTDIQPEWNEVVGCKLLTRKQWDKGLSKKGLWNQTNCPLLKEDSHE